MEDRWVFVVGKFKSGWQKMPRDPPKKWTVKEIVEAKRQEIRKRQERSQERER